MSSTSPMNGAAPAQPSAPARRPWRTLSRMLVALLVAAWSVLLIAWLILHWGILPRIEQWRPQIEMRASQALGVPVRIGAIEVRSSGWVPAIELRDVRLFDTQQRPALQLPRVSAALSPRSLLSLQLRFEQLLIEGADLEVRRNALGRLSIGGIEFGAAISGDDNAAADWLFRQGEFVIRGGTLRWIDEQRLAPPLALTDVQLVVRNGLRHHDLRLDATPPVEWGDRFSVHARFTQPLLARPGDWRRWSGEAYAELPRVDLRELRLHVTLPFELSEGNGALRGWVELVDGVARGATVDVALRAVALRLAPEVEPLAFEQVEGRISGRRDADGGAISVRRLGFLTGDGVRWPPGDLALSWRQRTGEPVDGGEFKAQRLDIGLMAQVATRIPLGEAMRKLLLGLQPQGVASDLSLGWDGPIDAPLRYQARGSFGGLWLAALPSTEPGAIGRPGLRNAGVEVRASETGGQASINMNGGALELPGVFDEPVVPLDTLSAQLQWKIEPVRGAAPRVTLQVKDARLSNPDLTGELSGSWSTGAGEGIARGGRYPGRVDLNGKVARGVAARAARYLPLGVAPASRDYVARAVRDGSVSGLTIRVAGDLWDFPFYGAKTAREGEFRIAARAEDVTFAYVPDVPASGAEPAWVSPWPPFTRVSGDLVIDRATLELNKVRATLGTLEWNGIQGGIRNLVDRPVLALEGSARGPLAEMLRIVDATPIAGWTGRALAKASATGRADLKLGLAIPLAEPPATTVKGSLALGGNDLRIAPDTPLLGNARGRVDFTHKGVAVIGANARVLGGDASFEGSTQADGTLRFSGQGVATAEGLRRATELGPLARAAGALSGQASYRVNLAFVRGLPELTVTSTLVGLASDLPAPLRKSAEAPLALRYQTQLVPESLAPGQIPRDNLRLELGALLQAGYQRELQGDVPRVLRGGIGVLEPAPLPTSGVSLNASLTQFDADAWSAVADKLFPTAATPSAGDAPAYGGYGPTLIALRAQQVVIAQRRLNRVVAGLSVDEGLWRANLDAEQFNGYVEYRPSRPAVAGRVYARLSRLSLPKSDAEDVESLLEQQPATIPSLDIVVDDFELRGKRLGRVEIEAVNRGEAGAREWQLAKFKLAVPEAQLNATGSWAALAGAPVSARRRSQMDFRLDVTNAGALLERLGTGRAIRGGKGSLTGQVGWQGSPLSLDMASLTGDVNVAIDAGQFLKADPGAARLLGVLSLQSLPRRLALDFRDVFQEGFAFDSVTGDVKIARGLATTNNLRMRGVQAVVLMEGSADIERETQDLRVIVVPEINAGTASLAYAAINPAIGLGTFLAQVFLRRPLIQAGTREFHVTGPWADPKVDRVERKATDPVPDVDAPAAAASAPARKP